MSRKTSGAAALMAALFLSTVASAGDDAAARDHFNAAVRLSKEGKSAEALGEFQASYDANPNWKVLYNIGVLSRQLHDEARSLRAFDRYLSEGRDEITKQRRVEVETAIRELKPQVGTIDVTVNMAGATVKMDGKRLGESPLPEPVLANVGRHKIVVSTGSLSVDRDIDLAGGTTVKVDILLVDQGPKITPPPPTSTAPPPPPKNPWIARTWLVAGGLTAAGVATGIAALIASNSLSHSTYAWTDPTFQSRATTVKTLATVTDVLVIGGIAAGGAALYLTLAKPAKPKTAPGVRVGIGLGGASLGGSF